MIYSTMIFVLATICFLALLFVLIKKTNDSVYETGRILASEESSLEFLSRRVNSLNSHSDKAMFHFLVNRPWRETNLWFDSIYSIDKESTGSHDIEILELRKSIKEAMLGEYEGILRLAMQLKGLPAEVRRLRPHDYNTWAKLNKQVFDAHPEFTVSRFVSASSIMAARACIKYS